MFVVSSYFNILAQTMSQMFVRGIAELAEAWVAINRLQRFLDYDEFQSRKAIDNIPKEKNGTNYNEKEKNNVDADIINMNIKNQVFISVCNKKAI